MSEYFDSLETRSPEERNAAQMTALSKQVALARGTAGYSVVLADVDPTVVTSREALAALPVTRKSELIERQTPGAPLGGLNATPIEGLARFFISPGPIAEPQGRRGDFWRIARALFAAGFRKGDRVHNCFSYHFTPAGMMFDSGAIELGCVVFPGGIGQTEQQVAAMVHFKPSAYAGTPDFLKIILEKGDEIGADLSSVEKALVGGGALLPPLRQTYADRGISVLQCYGTADVGNIAYESKASEGMILDEGVIVEIVRPGTGDPVPEGEVGEVLVTILNEDYPLLRFATGDLSAILPGQSPCGRTGPRIKGWMGRADQRTKVRGMFVDPAQVDRVLKGYPQVARMRLVIGEEGGLDTSTLRCETLEKGDAFAKNIAGKFQAECKVRATVELVSPGDLPNDGKVIDDVRQYE